MTTASIVQRVWNYCNTLRDDGESYGDYVEQLTYLLFLKKFTYDEIISRDKTNLDIFWLKDDSLADLENLPDPDIIANEIIENIEAGLESFREIVEGLNNKQNDKSLIFLSKQFT